MVIGMYRVFYCKFRPDKQGPFKEWLRKNRKTLEERLPDGVKLVGCYFVKEGSAEYDYEDWWELKNWKAMDDFAKAEKFHELDKILERDCGAVFEWWRVKYLEKL